MTIKTKLPIQYCMNGITIIIGQLGIVHLANRKTGRNHVNNQISRLFINKISIIVCKLVC